MIAGVLLVPLASHTETWWAWTLAPPAAAGFLGAAYWAAVVLLAWSASGGRWIEARTALPPVMTIAVLLLVATLIHLDRFDMSSLAGPFWLTAYVVVPVLLMVLVVRQLRVPGDDRVRREPLPRGLRALVALQGVVMVGLGAALFVAPGTVDDAWPWPLTPLAARATGAFVTGFGVAALDAVLEDDRTRFRGAALAYLALGILELLVSAIFAGDVDDGSPEAVVYRLFLVSVVAAGAWGAAASGASAARASSGSS